ncbi:MAG: hypothetical protein ACYC3Q_12185 [Gemmatimonadaceae bacterium]
MLHPPQPQDKSAGFTGLIVGAIALGAILYGMVHWTNLQFAGDETPAGAAQTTTH